jgi:hypothetical protein
MCAQNSTLVRATSRIIRFYIVGNGHIFAMCAGKPSEGITASNYISLSMVENVHTFAMYATKRFVRRAI